MFASTLEEILSIRGLPPPPPCVADLVSHGLCLDRFPSGTSRPLRVDVPLFLSAWCRRVGLGPRDYQDWLIDYSLAVLGPLSHSSPSAIRHSTKSSLLYIHRSEVAFICNAEHNAFRAQCSPTCPLYQAMSELYASNEAIRLQKIAEEQALQDELRRQREAFASDPANMPISKRYRAQYDEAIQLISQLLSEGLTKKAISGILNEKGFKTRRGHVWSPAQVVTAVAASGLPVKKRPSRKAVSQ